METLDIEKFNPTKAEITDLVSKYSALEIKGVDDRAGYALVDNARKELKKVRINIEKTGKSLRAEALAFQKAVIEKEKELVGMVEPTEIELQDKQNQIDLEKEKIKRKELLPERRFKMKAISLAVDDDFLLLMDDPQFNAFYNQKNSDFLAEKERKLREEQEKVEAEKRKIEDEKQAQEREKQRQIELEEVRKDAESKAKAEMKLQAEKAKKLAKEQEEQWVRNEKSIQDKLEKDKKYQAFLKKNKYVNGSDFIIQHNGNKIVLYKKVDEIEL